MSTRYHSELAAREATKALLHLLKFGTKKISELVFGMQKQGVDLTPEQTRRMARYLRDNKYLKGSAQGGYSLTSAGLQRLIDLELKTINVPTRWDGKWRLILFDIPEAKRVLRDQTRRLIKELHCIQLQQSVWVHPFPCFSQFRQIQKAYGRSNDIILIETDTIEGATHLIKIFGKIYSRTKF